MLSTVKDSHWLKNNGSLVWCQNRKQCSKPISFRIPPEGSTKTLLSQAKARGQVTVVGRPACVCIPGAPRNLPVCEMISWFLLHVSNVYPTKNWMELTAEQRLERNRELRAVVLNQDTHQNCLGSAVWDSASNYPEPVSACGPERSVIAPPDHHNMRRLCVRVCTVRACVPSGVEGETRNLSCCL
ncbi:uncharacterized protein AAG666_008674 isoform 2-T9 [Megaptera novaeangliae]